MSHSRAYWIVMVGIGVITLCEPFTGPNILPTPADEIVNVAFLFVQGAAAWCVGSDLHAWLKARA